MYYDGYGGDEYDDEYSERGDDDQRSLASGFDQGSALAGLGGDGDDGMGFDN